MSFVSVMANSEVLTLVTDGRVMKVEDSTIIDENYKKYVKISENQFIAYTGAKETCESIVNQIEFNKDAYDLKQIADEIYNVIISDERLINHDLLFIVGGLNPERQIEFHGFSRRESIQSYKPPKKSTIDYAYLYTSETDLNVDVKLKELVSRIGTSSVNKRLKIQEELNKFIADHDNTVNRITFKLRIKDN